MRRSARWGAVSLLLIAAAGCGGRAEQDAARDDNDDAPLSAACSGTLELSYEHSTVSESAPLRCTSGVSQLAHGFGLLQLTSDKLQSLRLTLPALETGSYAYAECALAHLQKDGKAYNPEMTGLGPTPPDISFTLKRLGNELRGQMKARLCAQVGSQLMGDAFWPIYECIIASISNLRARIEDSPPCVCPSTMAGSSCAISTCGDDCGQIYCPSSAPVCTGLSPAP